MMKQSPTVMVVEDEILLLQAICKKLEHSGLEVISCASGEQALDYLANLGELPDAIWLDFYLKDTNGLDLLQKIKQEPAWAKIPVVVVSNSASPDKVHTMLALGAKRYILKAEHRLDEIVKIVREFIAESSESAAEPTEAA